MTDPANPGVRVDEPLLVAPIDDAPLAPAGPTDDERLRAYADELADGIVAALGPWVERSVAHILDAWQPDASVADVARRDARAAGDRATAAIGPDVRALLATDVDAQRTSPLAIVREAVRYPTEVLAAAGAPHVRRDEFAERAFPSDVYGLSPATFSDLDPALHGPGLSWGAAKAHIVLTRRRAEGLR